MRLSPLTSTLVTCAIASCGGGDSTSPPPQQDLGAPDLTLRVGCSSGTLDGKETDVDCGGSCAPCDLGKQCKKPEDCKSATCTGGKCVVAPCMNGVFDDNETDVDCGGNYCAPCPDGKKCGRSIDCQSGRCDVDVYVCKPPLLCMPGSADCDGSGSNGCEVDIDTDRTHCGTCDKRCALNQWCVKGVCELEEFKLGNWSIAVNTVTHDGNLLLGSEIGQVVTPSVVVRFGLASRSVGQRVQMALYRDAGNAPGQLVASSVVGVVNGKSMELPAQAVAQLAPGRYWVMAIYDGQASVGATNAGFNPIQAARVTFGDPLPPNFPMPMRSTGVLYGYWIVVTQ